MVAMEAAEHPLEQVQEEIDGVSIELTTYRWLDRYLCRDDELPSKIVLARGEGATSREAFDEARERALRQLGLTRSLELAVQRVANLRADLGLLKIQLGGPPASDAGPDEG